MLSLLAAALVGPLDEQTPHQALGRAAAAAKVGRSYGAGLSRLTSGWSAQRKR
jgi:hypothetical protein